MTSATAPGTGVVRTDNLALIFQEVLTAVVRLRSNRQELSDAESFRFHIREAIRSAVQEARNQSGYNSDDIKMATLALVGFLDESILNTRNPLFADWPRKPLQEELFGIHMAGEVFFQNLEKLLGRQDSADLADVLEVHYLCLLLGYAGRYSLGGRGELQAVITATGDRIRRIRGASNDPYLTFQKEPDIVPSSKDPWAKGLLIAAIVCALILVGSFVAFKVILSSGASSLTTISTQARS